MQAVPPDEGSVVPGVPDSPDDQAQEDGEGSVDPEIDLEPEPDSLDWASRAALRDLLHAVEEHLAEHGQEPGDVLDRAIMMARAELSS